MIKVCGSTCTHTDEHIIICGILVNSIDFTNVNLLVWIFPCFWIFSCFGMQNINLGGARVKGAWDLPVHFFAISYKSIIFQRKRLNDFV